MSAATIVIVTSIYDLENGAQQQRRQDQRMNCGGLTYVDHLVQVWFPAYLDFMSRAQTLLMMQEDSDHDHDECGGGVKLEIVLFTQANLMKRCTQILLSSKCLWLMKVDIRVFPISHYSIPMRRSLQLPQNRNATKDTVAYFELMNSKFDFVSEAAKLRRKRCSNSNQGTTASFMWLDAGFTKLFNRDQLSFCVLSKFIHLLKTEILSSPCALSSTTTTTTTMVVLGGCQGSQNNGELQSVNWHFLGTWFAIPRQENVSLLAHIMREEVDFIANEECMMTWEINVWVRAFRRHATNISYKWIYCNHDENIFGALDRR
jgi:hypothetical protein